MNREYINKLIKCRRVGKLIKLCDDNLYYWSEDDYDYLINNERYQKERKFVTKKNKYIYVQYHTEYKSILHRIYIYMIDVMKKYHVDNFNICKLTYTLEFVKYIKNNTNNFLNNASLIDMIRNCDYDSDIIKYLIKSGDIDYFKNYNKRKGKYQKKIR